MYGAKLSTSRSRKSYIKMASSRGGLWISGVSVLLNMTALASVCLIYACIVTVYCLVYFLFCAAQTALHLSRSPKLLPVFFFATCSHELFVLPEKFHFIMIGARGRVFGVPQLGTEEIATSDVKLHKMFWPEIFHEIFLKYFKNVTTFTTFSRAVHSPV